MADATIKTTRKLLHKMTEQIEEGKMHSTNMGTLHQLQSSIEARQTEVEKSYKSIAMELSKIDHFREQDLPKFKALQDSFTNAQIQQPTDLTQILKTVDDRISDSIQQLESQLNSRPAAAHVVQMIHDETKFHDLVKRLDDAESAIFEYSQTNHAGPSSPVNEDTISAMVDTRMVSYNARDKNELRNILDTQCQVLEDIETHLRHLDAESDDRVMHLVDSRMQRNAVVDHQHLQQVLNTHQSTLQQTTTDVLTTLQKEK